MQYLINGDIINLFYGANNTKSGCGMAEEYMTAAQAAEKWNISQRRVQILCAGGRISGVFKLGEVWAIPKSTLKPADARKSKGGNKNA